MYYIVHFHADGGQMCVPGRRVFLDSGQALAFFNRCATEKDHTCINSVRMEASKTNPGDEGEIYPAVANLNA
jgi:hypothetical protein